MSETAVIITVIGIVTLVIIGLINYKFRQSHFEMWVEQFEMILEQKVSEEDKDSILRDLFADDGISMRQAIILYKEAKNNG